MELFVKSLTPVDCPTPRCCGQPYVTDNYVECQCGLRGPSARNKDRAIELWNQVFSEPQRPWRRTLALEAMKCILNDNSFINPSGPESCAMLARSAWDMAEARRVLLALWRTWPTKTPLEPLERLARNVAMAVPRVHWLDAWRQIEQKTVILDDRHKAIRRGLGLYHSKYLTELEEKNRRIEGAAGDRRDALLVQLEAELAGCSGDLLVTSLALHDACMQLHREGDFHLAKEFDALEASLIERGYVWDENLEAWKAPAELEA